MWLTDQRYGKKGEVSTPNQGIERHRMYRGRKRKAVTTFRETTVEQQKKATDFTVGWGREDRRETSSGHR